MSAAPLRVSVLLSQDAAGSIPPAALCYNPHVLLQYHFSMSWLDERLMNPVKCLCKDKESIPRCFRCCPDNAVSTSTSLRPTCCFQLLSSSPWSPPHLRLHRTSLRVSRGLPQSSKLAPARLCLGDTLSSSEMALPMLPYPRPRASTRRTTCIRVHSRGSRVHSTLLLLKKSGSYQMSVFSLTLNTLRHALTSNPLIGRSSMSKKTLCSPSRMASTPKRTPLLVPSSPS